MSDKAKKKFLIAIACILAIAGTLCGIYYPDKPINNTIGEYQNIVKEEIKAIDDDVVIEDITENEQSSNENTIEDVTIQDEFELEDEFLTEDESFELQGDISYDGNGDKFGLTITGNPQLTYISQIDLRWKDYPYTSTNNKNQTIGSSGCGVASATMVIDSIVGQVNIKDIADTFVKCGYRSANNGTYWSAYRAVADEFNIGYTETSDIQKALDLLRSKNYVICSVGNGLFTTSGHYIVIVGIEENTLKIYDPYLYNGKFNTSTRKGKVEVSGNTIYCSIENFKNYANYKGFFCYQDVEHNESKYKAGDRILINDPVGVAYKTNTKYLVDNYINQYWIHKSVVFDDNRVYGLGIIAYDGGKVDLVQIFDTQFWCSESNMNEFVYTNDIQTVITNKMTNTVGQTKILKSKCNLYQNSNFSGTVYTYKSGTKIKILENISNNIDKVQVIATGRIAYIDKKYYK